MSVASDPQRWRRAPLRWSYRLKVPLALGFVALAAGLAVATSTYLLVYRYVETNAAAQAQRLARTLARSLVQPMLANDVWNAFQTVRASSIATASDSPQNVQVWVLDAQGTVFVARDPRNFPLGLPASRLPERLIPAARWILEGSRGGDGYRYEGAAPDSLVVAERLFGDEDSLVGGVIVEQESAISRAQARSIAQQLAALGSLAILLVALIGWIGGRRMVRPLEVLRDAMREVPSGDVRATVDDVSRRNDEVGDLGRAFLGMTDEIDAKRRLERDMLNAERMASIGRLTAGIAHEVNNPLGGMLAAIGNRRLRGGVDDATERTLGLLERGLEQIHSTVSALLNEARREVHELRTDDLQDLHLLLHPEAESVGCALDWRVDAPVTRSLPAVPVRQVVLNLVLNAIAAAGAGGRVVARSQEADNAWRVHVANTGTALGDVEFDRLLEATPRDDDGRTGLGIWVTRRILESIGGRLDRQSPPEPGFATALIATFPSTDAQSSP